MIPGLGLLSLWLALVAPVTLRAGSLEFRSDGFFASPDAQVRFVREPWQYASHVDVDGTPAMMLVGPILHPGYQSFAGETTKAAYEAAKEGNAACRVVGVCATSDFAGKPGSFTDAVLKLGGARYFDLLSVHLSNLDPA